MLWPLHAGDLMQAKIFLSLSFVDADFVRAVHARLPRGLAYFYEASFDNGEALLSAMERAVGSASIFVLFASTQSVKSKAVLFEIDQARAKAIFQQNVRMMVFPTDPDVTFRDLPPWLQQHWVGSAGWGAADIARYITATLLAPEGGLSGPAKVVGRGQTLDRLDGIVGDHLASTRKMPNVYVLVGLTGIGRKTFAEYYLRRSLDAEANLPYGPTFLLPAQADPLDLYRAVRSEISAEVDPAELANDVAAFQSAAPDEQLAELIRLLGHFWSLRQAVTFASSAGFFEDRGTPKEWVSNLIAATPPDALLILISNRHFDDGVISGYGNAVQMNVDTLTDANTKTLMTYTASRLKVEEFAIADELVRAIGGHADIANLAVRLVSKRGSRILERDPAQLMNIQQTILGESVDEENLSPDERAVLDTLCWVPSLGSDLVEEVVRVAAGVDEARFLQAADALVSACLVTTAQYRYAITPAIRHLYRRRYVTPQAITEALGAALSAAWAKGAKEGSFREDVFEASVFMHTYLGEDLPDELRNLISPGLLSNLMREAYAKAKNTDEEADLRRVISLGRMAEKMKMSHAVREEILSTLVSAQIRAWYFPDATRTIELMERNGYRAATFSRGYMLRRQEKYPEAIVVLKAAVEESKFNRAALHELALSYLRSNNHAELSKLLERNKRFVTDSAMLTDFQIGLDLAHNALGKVEAGIRRLRALSDDDGRSSRREAQLLMKRDEYEPAKRILSELIDKRLGSRFMLRSLRAVAAARSGDFRTAARDIEFIKSVPGRGEVATRLQAELFAARDELEQADALLSTLKTLRPQDHILRARIFDLKAERPGTGLAARQELKRKAAELRAQYITADDEYDD